MCLSQNNNKLYFFLRALIAFMSRLAVALLDLKSFLQALVNPRVAGMATKAWYWRAQSFLK